MSFSVVLLWTPFLLPATAQGLCQLSDCSSLDKVRSNCPAAEFKKSAVYRPLDQFKPSIKKPHHLFNLIYDESSKDCIEVVLSPSIHDSSGFNYDLFVSCRSELPCNVYLSLDAYLYQGSVACLHRSDLSILMLRRCNIFAEERIRFNFVWNKGLLLLEDLSSQGYTKSWLMLQKSNISSGERCNCTKLAKFRDFFQQCMGRVLSGKKEPRNVRFGLKISIGLMVGLALLFVAYFWAVSGQKLKATLFQPDKPI